jgi:hypothetical protein
MQSLRRLDWHTRQRVLPKSALGKACYYLLAQWPPLSEHLRHGESRPDNNLVEKALRPAASAKKLAVYRSSRRRPALRHLLLSTPVVS